MNIAPQISFLPSLLKKYWKESLVLVSLTTVLFTVFAVDDFLWQGAITAKYFWYAAAMCIVVTMLPVTLFLHKGKLRIADVAVGLLVIYVGINFFLLNRWPNMHWWMFRLMIPLYVTVRIAGENENLRRWLLDAVLAVVLVEAVWGLLQLYGFAYSNHSLYKITGSLFNPGPYSGFVAVGVPLGLGYMMNMELSKWERWLGAVTLAAALLVLPPAMSRAAWLAAIVGSVPVLWKRFRGSGFRFQGSGFGVNFVELAGSVRVSGWRRIVVLAGGGALTALLLVGVYLMKKDSADGRWLIWQASAKVVKEHPLFGVGYGRFAATYGEAQAQYFLDGQGTDAQAMVADSPDHAFNEYVQITVELGIVGLLLFLLAVASTFLTRHSSLVMCHPALITILVFAAFSYPFSVLPLGILFVFLLTLSASSSRQMSFAIPAWLRVTGIAACMCLAVYGALQVLPIRKAYREWSSLQMLYNSGAYKGAAKEYKSWYPLLKHEKQFLFEYGQCLAKTEQYAESNQVFEQYLHYGSDPMVYNCMGNNFKATGDYPKAENAYIRASQIVPNRHYPLYLLMKLYQETGQVDKANAIAQTILNKPVKVKSTAIREMQEEARKVREEKLTKD